MITRGFIDLLFILLCSTIVMLSESVQLKALDAAPAKVGSGGVSAVDADAVVIVAVGVDHLDVAGERVEVAQLDPQRTALLVPADAHVTHHRVMAVWTQLREAGVRVQLGVEPGRPAEGDR